MMIVITLSSLSGGTNIVTVTQQSQSKSVSYTNSHFIREGAIAILRAPVQPVQAQVGPRDGRGGLVA